MEFNLKFASICRTRVRSVVVVFCLEVVVQIVEQRLPKHTHNLRRGSSRSGRGGCSSLGDHENGQAVLDGL